MNVPSVYVLGPASLDCMPRVLSSALVSPRDESSAVKVAS